MKTAVLRTVFDISIGYGRTTTNFVLTFMNNNKPWLLAVWIFLVFFHFISRVSVHEERLCVENARGTPQILNEHLISTHEHKRMKN